MNIIVLTDRELIAVYVMLFLAIFITIIVICKTAWKIADYAVDKLFPVKNEMPALPQKSSV